MYPSWLRVFLRVALVIGTLGCGGPAAGSLVGTWQARDATGPISTFWTFTGTDASGRFVWHNPNGASLPPGCAEELYFRGSYAVTGTRLAVTTDAAEAVRRCSDPSGDFVMTLPSTVFASFDMRLSSPFAVTATTLTIESGMPPLVFDRVATEVPDAGPPTADAGPIVPCAGERADVSAAPETWSLAIGRDGTVWLATSDGRVARIRRGRPLEIWGTISTGSTLMGAVLSADGTSLYVAIPAEGNIAVLDTTAPSLATRLPTVGRAAGLTLGGDGALYYVDAETGDVLRLVPDGTSAATRVSASPVPGVDLTGAPPASLAFAADGTLLVPSPGTGTLVRLTLTGGVESARATFASGLGTPVGVALDVTGRAYVTDLAGGRIVRTEADGTGATDVVTGVAGLHDVEFGAGPLGCSDLYAPGFPFVVFDAGADGAPVPWH